MVTINVRIWCYVTTELHIPELPLSPVARGIHAIACKTLLESIDILFTGSAGVYLKVYLGTWPCVLAAPFVCHVRINIPRFFDAASHKSACHFGYPRSDSE
jgi:hypothetical protein